MVYPEAYIEYLMYFHGNRDYFECHEVLEEYWKEVDPGNRTSHWVGLIQVAVGFYHYRRGNQTGAVRTFNKAIKNIESNHKELTLLGIHSGKLQAMIEETLNQISENQPYHSIILPLMDVSLSDQVQLRCRKNGYIWCGESDLTNSALIHRHSLRDRTDVITERKNALRKKRGGPPE